MSVRPRAIAMLAMLVGAASCSATTDGPSGLSTAPLPTFTRDHPASKGEACEDPVGDISNDAGTTAPGTLTEPRGIDLTHTEAFVIGDHLSVKATTVGPWESATNPSFSVGQGDPSTLPAVSWQLRFLKDTGGWRAELTTFPNQAGQVQKTVKLSAKVVVAGNQLQSDIPLTDLPVIATILWQFGSASGVSDETRVFDDCLPVLNKAGGAPQGTATAPGPGSVVAPTVTTVPIVGTIGTPVASPDGAEVTLLTVDDPARPDHELKVASIPKTHLAAIEVMVCAKSANVDKVGEGRFTALPTDGPTGIAPWPAPEFTNSPRFPASQTLRPADCPKGWITFQIPNTAKVAKVIYDSSGVGSGPFVTISV